MAKAKYVVKGYTIYTKQPKKKKYWGGVAHSKKELKEIVSSCGTWAAGYERVGNKLKRIC